MLWPTGLEGNPYCHVIRDERGRPCIDEAGQYCITESAEKLQAQALRKFCELYPPMTELPEQFPPELYNPEPEIYEQVGYLLHYGFRVTKEQANECIVNLRLKRPCKSWDLDVDVICQDAILTEEFADYGVSVEAIADPDLMETKVVALYNNEREGLDWSGEPYDEDRKRRVIDRIAAVLSPFTQQTEPLWYWDVSHSPDFARDWSPSNPPAWDILQFTRADMLYEV
ncbi:hypothetical protein FKP32DRAFT_1671596 [Trametes sanguinea]|nr:hypothetical protein FKP32DRAFT_1671596 [Trametes sanguinea]